MDAAIHSDKLLTFFKALADANRLKIIGLLANQPSTVEKLALQLGLSAATVSHHLSKLSEADLVTAKADGHYSIYSLRTDVLESLSRTLLARDNLPRLAEDVDVDAYERKVINDFTNPDGSLRSFPSQRKKMIVLLGYLSRAFKKGEHYAEKEVNEILQQYHPDFASLRRDLIDVGYMQRAAGEYWLTELGYNSSRSYR
jgi:DNA-binding HxlR family transcriptional regulator